MTSRLSRGRNLRGRTSLARSRFGLPVCSSKGLSSDPDCPLINEIECLAPMKAQSLRSRTAGVRRGLLALPS
jgi:hypothetical protein